MSTDNQPAIFNDALLLEHLEQKKIPYAVDADGFIDVLENADGKKREIDIRGYDHVIIDKLRSSGSIRAGKAMTFQANKLKHVKGCIDAKEARAFQALELEDVQGNFLENHIDARSAKIFQTPKLKVVDSYLKISEVIEPTIPNLETVASYLDAGKATKFHAEKLHTVGQYVDIRSAEDVQLNGLKDSGTIYSHDSLAGKQAGNLHFSDKIGSRDAVSIFNENTEMVKIGHHKWMKLDAANQMIDEKYPDQEFGTQYKNFFNRVQGNKP